jgi:hypothetical protein
MSVSMHLLHVASVRERRRDRERGRWEQTYLLRLPLLQPIKPRKDSSFLRLQRMHIGDEISGAECRIERREGTAECLCGGEECSGLRAEVEDLGVELGELFGGACFGCVLQCVLVMDVRRVEGGEPGERGRRSACLGRVSWVGMEGGCMHAHQLLGLRSASARAGL